MRERQFWIVLSRATCDPSHPDYVILWNRTLNLNRPYKLNNLPADPVLRVTLNIPKTMAHADQTLHDFDLRIRALSSLISKLNQRIESPDPLRSSPALNACNHIAILLTRGIEDSNGSPIRPGRKVVAVSGRLASKSFTVTIDPDQDPAGELSAPIVNQNPTPKDRPKFKITTLKPSPTRLEDMVALPCVPSAFLYRFSNPETMIF